MTVVATTPATIPVIDIASLLRTATEGEKATTSESSSVVTAISAAVHSHGIFAVSGHGIPDQVMSAALQASRDSLERGGHAEQECWRELEASASTRLPGEYPNFSSVGLENIGLLRNGNDRSGKDPVPAEFVSKFTVWPPNWDADESIAARQRNIWPATEGGGQLKQALEDYHVQVQRVSDALHGALSQTLGKPSTFIQDMLSNCSQGTLRANCYQREDGLAGESSAAPALAAHRDLGTTTLVLSDAPGLQFQPRDSDDWIDAVAPPGALIVNLGEFFEVWTSGAWQATVHRVTPAVQPHRTSLAFFSNQAIPMPLDGSAPQNCSVVPLEQVPDAACHEVTQQGKSVATGGAACVKSVQWPAYFFERIADLRKGAEELAEACKADNPAAAPRQGGA